LPQAIGKGHKPGHFRTIKKIPDKILKPEKEDMSGITRTYGHPRLWWKREILLIKMHAYIRTKYVIHLIHVNHTST